MEWISVKDRLPDDYTRVIVYGSTCGCACGLKKQVFESKFSIDRGFEVGEYDCDVEATHWMPLPEPPQD